MTLKVNCICKITLRLQVPGLHIMSDRYHYVIFYKCESLASMAVVLGTSNIPHVVRLVCAELRCGKNLVTVVAVEPDS